MIRSKAPYVFLGIAALITLSAVIFWSPRIVRSANHFLTDKENSSETATSEPQVNSLQPKPAEELAKPMIAPIPKDPATLVAQFAKALQTADIDGISKLINKHSLDTATLNRLKELCTSPLQLRQIDPIREIGELEMNNHSRWALALDGRIPGNDQIVLDLRQMDGKWMIEKIMLPNAQGSTTPMPFSLDSLGTADAFLQALLKQDCESALRFTDQTTISDAKLAALCILFEEGNYRLRKSKPLRAIFQRADAAGYLAYVQSSDATEDAQFSMTLHHPVGRSNWIVSEINLDQLLVDYTQRIAGGNSYFTPLVKNPAGGETLAIYFEFDQDQMSPRTRRQLEIVARILLSDPGKKITLSGHTDAMGTKDYNNSLSGRRASVVRDVLTKFGVNQRQIVTLAKGDSQPRRPNVMENGKDNPEGRRANRRTEIYLDF
jgi:outer membrane protein OmpA-like peptidoglycan-associated protein